MVMKHHIHKNSYLSPLLRIAGLPMLIISLFLFLLLQSPLLWAEVSASTDRTVLSIDETVSLEIKSKNGSGEPDLSILEQDFQILGKSQSQNYSLINGNASRTHIWNISLLPRKTGEITIPAIKIGSESTSPIHLVVQKQSTNPGIEGKDVFLKIELSDNEIRYVQQQIIVKVQLFHRIRFVNAALSELELENTVVEKLGNDSNYSKTIANHRYNVIERNYAIFPQQSGTLTIPALTFSGNTEISQSFSLFSRPGRQIISRTRPVTLEILAIPENYTGKHWLPAEDLQLESEILEDIDTIKTGEAITRHIVVRATGLLGSQLPGNTVPSSDKIKTYPDKEKLSTQLIGGNVVGIRRDAIAIIPLKEGPFALPEIKIDWWNTKTNQQETTTLPARTLFAQRNADLAANDSTQQASETSTQAKPSPVETTENAPAVKETLVYTDTPFSKNLWFWISMILLLLWLATMALFIASRSKNTPKHKATEPDNNAENLLQSIYDACLENDATKTTAALIQWAKYYFKQPMLTGLSQVIELVDHEALIETINHLEQSQYSAHKESWNGASLKSAIQAFIEQENLQKEQLTNSNQAFAPLNLT